MPDYQPLHRYEQFNVDCEWKFYSTYLLSHCTSNEKVMRQVTPQKGRAMAQAVSRRPPTAEARVRSRASTCGGQSGTGTGFFFTPEYFGFPLSISFRRCSITGKMEKTNLSSSSQGCTISLKAAVRP
jgi:hypothetical protein